MAAVLVNSCLIRPSALSATFSNSPSLKTLVIRCAMRSVGYPTPATALAIDAYLAVQYAHSVKTFPPLRDINVRQRDHVQFWVPTVMLITTLALAQVSPAKVGSKQ